MSAVTPARTAQGSLSVSLGTSRKSVEFTLHEVEAGVWYADISGTVVPRLLGTTRLEITLPPEGA